ncbi:unnamed protein product, partial [Mesorhabditis belari]|uniref:Uncharacterized protein n=1 Tax=Mesorhabditis belari TaxID=2138241 RepID=A0AAF3J749_9BILA
MFVLTRALQTIGRHRLFLKENKVVFWLKPSSSLADLRWILLIQRTQFSHVRKTTEMEYKKKKSLMQRLQSWLEGFPLGRGNKERRSRKTSHSAAPTYRIPEAKNSTAPRRQPSFLEPKKNRGKPVAVKQPIAPVIYADPWDQRLPGDFPMGGSLSQSFSSQRSSNIRTNPWIQRDRASMRHLRKPEHNMERSDLSFSSMDRSHLRVKSFEESVCSSGYGSQDSSPESSVHSPNWQSARESADKAVECRSIDVDEALGFLEESSSFSPYDNLRRFESTEHIYHELESLTRISRVLDDRAYVSDSECPSCSSPTSFSRPNSPIYARPYDGPMARPYVEERQINRGKEQPNYRQNSTPKAPNLDSLPRRVPNFEPIYAAVKPTRPRMLPVIPQTYSLGMLPARPLPPLLRPEPIRPSPVHRPAPKFCAPPPPPLNLDDELEKAEMDFLAELDAQIAELQLATDFLILV